MKPSSEDSSPNPFVMDNASETSLQFLLSCIRDISGTSLFCEEAMRRKSMFGMKSDCDVSYYEAEYLISKGWNPGIFRDY